MQYRNVIFYHNEEQYRLAVESKKRLEEKLGTPVYTEIIPFTRFYIAEDYHQKYYLQQEREIYKELRKIYPDMEDFINSTAAARLNGYAAVYGSIDTLQNSLDKFGLSQSGRERLLKMAQRGLRPGCLVN